jgi:hypothetical protein
MVDRGTATSDYGVALYFSTVTIANLGGGDISPSMESRFVWVTEGLIGYVALAFLAALLFATIQRGTRAQAKVYNKRRRAFLLAEAESNTDKSSSNKSSVDG